MTEWLSLLARLVNARARGEDVEVVEGKTGVGSADVPDAGVRASELLSRVIWVAVVIIKNDAV